VDDQIHAAAELGTRFVVSRGSMSLGESKGGLPPDDCVEDESAIRKDSRRVIEQYHDPRPGSMLQIVLAPCSPFSVTADLMRESAGLARHHRVRLHAHLCETLDEERYTLQRHGLRSVAYMESLDWVADDVWYAHAIHVNDDEIRLFARQGVGACHCPSSNMRLASGIAPALEIATLGGAAVLGRSDIGSLEPGKCGDFFTLDLSTIGYAGGLSDPVAAVVFCAPQPARHTVVGGRAIVQDGRIVTLAIEPVIEEHNRHVKALVGSPGRRVPIV
jgi:cytosine/adenosine deaminase-related metal-dependent hydrolase